MFDWLVVDGYNILFSWAEFEQLRCLDLGLARDKLAHILQDYCAFSGKKITLVFDAHMVKDSVTTVTKTGDFELIFTREGETADMLIEKMVGTAGPTEKVFVVTADWIEQSVIFGRGAFRMTPGELQQIIEQSKIRELEKLTEGQQAGEHLANRLNDNLREIMEKWRRDNFKPQDEGTGLPAEAAKISQNAAAKKKAKLRKSNPEAAPKIAEPDSIEGQSNNSRQLPVRQIKNQKSNKKSNKKSKVSKGKKNSHRKKGTGKKKKSGNDK